MSLKSVQIVVFMIPLYALAHRMTKMPDKPENIQQQNINLYAIVFDVPTDVETVSIFKNYFRCIVGLMLVVAGYD